MEKIERYVVVKSKGREPNQVTLKTRVAQEGEPFIVKQLLGEDAQLKALLDQKPCKIEKIKDVELSELSEEDKKRRAKRAAREAAKKQNDQDKKTQDDRKAADKGLIGKAKDKLTGGGRK